MNSRQVTYFLAVVDAESFSRAADALHISQSALSTRIAELERSSNVRLFERRPHGVVLTPAGRSLLPHARAIVEAFSNARRSLEAVEPGQAASVLIGVTPTIGASLLPTLLNVTRSMQLGLDWHAQQASTPRLLDLLAAGEIEAALCYGTLPLAQARSYPLHTQPMALIGTRATMGAGSGDVALPRLAEYGLVLDPPSHPGRKVIDTAALRHRVRLRVEAEIEPLNAKKMLVLEGGLCTVAPLHVFGTEIDGNLCVARRIVSPQLPLMLRLLVHHGVDARRAGTVRAAVQAAVAEAKSRGKFDYPEPASPDLKS